MSRFTIRDLQLELTMRQNGAAGKTAMTKIETD